MLDYGSLIYLALERAKTAREAIQVMTDLVAEYGYASTGESFSTAASTWGRKSALREPDGNVTHSASTGSRPRAERSGVPTYDHSAWVRTSTRTALGSSVSSR